MTAPLTGRDFDPGQQVRWCPGCGDYAVLKAVRNTLADIGAEPHNTAFVSGIGCAARLPYYVHAYGFHTVHGRAPAIATGLKMARPELDVWVITGDGDGMSIGAGHLHHVLRRNVDVQILLFNNRIYGLTKGQASPTSPAGLATASTPDGAPDAASDPCRFALGSGARFVAREIDINQAELRQVFAEAHAFPGAALVEILQNCPIYHDGAFASLRDRATGPEHVLRVRHGEPLVFGAEGERGLRLRPGSLVPEVVTLDRDDPDSRAGLLHHDETDPLLGTLLASLALPEFPVALGVLHRRPAPTPSQTPSQTPDQARHPAAVAPALAGDAAHAERVASIHDLLRDARTWHVG